MLDHLAFHIADRTFRETLGWICQYTSIAEKVVIGAGTYELRMPKFISALCIALLVLVGIGLFPMLKGERDIEFKLAALAIVFILVIAPVLLLLVAARQWSVIFDKEKFYVTDFLGRTSVHEWSQIRYVATSPFTVMLELGMTSGKQVEISLLYRGLEAFLEMLEHATRIQLRATNSPVIWWPKLDGMRKK